MTADLIPDETCAAAVAEARAVLDAEAPTDAVGDHVAAIAEDNLVVTHLFDARLPGYVGWRWAVTVTRAPGSDHVTVDEMVLLPGPDAIAAPDWVPWSERIRAGDLGPGDLLPTPADDARLVPGFTGTDDEADDLKPLLWELGLGRARVLSVDGRSDAAERWRRGAGGPRNETTRLAPGQCSTCGFLVPLGGPLGQEFGVCANDATPFDGTVVTMDHGCGAHSEAPPVPSSENVAEMVMDDDDLEITESKQADGADTSPGAEPLPEGAKDTDSQIG